MNDIKYSSYMSAEVPNQQPEKRYRLTGVQYAPEYWGGQRPNDGSPLTELYPDYNNRTIRFARSTLRDFSTRATNSSVLSVFRESTSLTGNLPIGSILYLEGAWCMDTPSYPGEIAAVFGMSCWGVVSPAAKSNPFGETVIIGFHEKRGVPDYQSLPIHERVFLDRATVFPSTFTVGDIWRDVIAEGEEYESLRKLNKVEIHAVGKARKIEKMLPKDIARVIGIKPSLEDI